MKINPLECHDRLLEFKSDWELISQGVQDCINNVPEEIKSPFYVFGHSRQIGMDERFNIFMQGYYRRMDEVPSERIIWMPRIYKPSAVPNSYLFRARKGTDIVETIWLLPKPELWDEYQPGKMMYNEDIWNSIQNYKQKRAELDATDNELTIEDINRYKLIMSRHASEKQKEERWTMLKT